MEKAQAFVNTLIGLSGLFTALYANFGHGRWRQYFGQTQQNQQAQINNLQGQITQIALQTPPPVVAPVQTQDATNGTGFPNQVSR